MDKKEIQRVRDESYKALKDTLNEFRRVDPKAADAVGAAVGSSLGGAASFTALYYGGAVAGLSAAGMTSGLAAAGAIVGGGMLAGMAVLAAPVAVFAVAGYAIARKSRDAKLAAALSTAIDKLYRIQERLMANADYFRNELAEIKAYIDELTYRQQS